jgi:hypothetical protein
MENTTLNSWKEIANYIGRGVRTVQRWELFFGLPVHRPAGRNRSAVYALRSEVDQWLQSRPVRDDLPFAEDGDGLASASAMGANGNGNGLAHPAEIRKRISELEAELQHLRKQLTHSRRAPVTAERSQMSSTRTA